MKKITFVLFALVLGLCAYAQNPEITQLGIGGRAVHGKTDFNSVEMFTKVADGEFAWYGKLYYNQTGSGNQGFKVVVNRTSPGNWLGDVWSLRATSGDLEVSDGNTYSTLYLQGNSNDNKAKMVITKLLFLLQM